MRTQFNHQKGIEMILSEPARSYGADYQLRVKIKVAVMHYIQPCRAMVYVCLSWRRM